MVVRSEATRYVWKPDRPKMDQTEKKQITSSTAVEDGVKEHKQKRLLGRPGESAPGFGSHTQLKLKDICQDSAAGQTPGLGPPGPLEEEEKKSDTEAGARGGGGGRSHLLSAKCVATQPKMNAVRKDSDTMKA